MIADRDVVVVGHDVVAWPVLLADERGLDVGGCPGLPAALEGDGEELDVALIVEVADVDDGWGRGSMLS